jgi:hypothetical protein
MAGGQAPPANWAGFVGAAGVIPPGGDVFVVVSGMARVQVGAATVAALALVGSDVIPRQGIGSATIGNLLAIAVEAQGQKDANNTIRCIVKVG